WLAQFNGGVPSRYFRKGMPVRLHPGAIPAKISRRVGDCSPKRFELRATGRTPSDGPSPVFGVWELEDFSVRDERVYGRSCDDLVGVASVLATLIDLKRLGRKVHVLGVISRAEEVGFLGALAVAGAGLLPRSGLVISLETSKELPSVKMGKG